MCLKNGKRKYVGGSLFGFVEILLVRTLWGTWIDATVFLTGVLPRYITESEFLYIRIPLEKLIIQRVLADWLFRQQGNAIYSKYDISILERGKLCNGIPLYIYASSDCFI